MGGSSRGRADCHVALHFSQCVFHDSEDKDPGSVVQYSWRSMHSVWRRLSPRTAFQDLFVPTGRQDPVMPPSCYACRYHVDLEMTAAD
eukprot:2792797-Rhodomonas_salina.3